MIFTSLITLFYYFNSFFFNVLLLIVLGYGLDLISPGSTIPVSCPTNERCSLVSVINNQKLNF